MRITAEIDRGHVPNDLARFCERQWAPLVGTLSVLTGDPALAEELAQEALARACLHWRRVCKMDLPGVWLHRVGVNLARSEGRRRATRSRLGWRASQPSHVESDTSTAIAVRHAVSELPERERVALALRYFADLSVRETALLMRCPEGTVRYLTHTAVLRLRESGLADVEEDDDDERS
jgi:RNA polymerase sigma factor (sigma-70 family)